MELKINQLQQTVKQREVSFDISSNDLKGIPPHMISTPKSQTILPPPVEKGM